MSIVYNKSLNNIPINKNEYKPVKWELQQTQRSSYIISYEVLRLLPTADGPSHLFNSAATPYWPTPALGTPVQVQCSMHIFTFLFYCLLSQTAHYQQTARVRLPTPVVRSSNRFHFLIPTIILSTCASCLLCSRKQVLK